MIPWPEALGRIRSWRPGAKNLVTALLVTDILCFGAAAVFAVARHEERRMRLEAQTLVDRLSGELIVAHEKLGQAQGAATQAEARLRDVLAEKETLLQELAQRDATIHEMGVELAQLKMKSKHVDLGKVVVSRGRGPEPARPAAPPPRPAETAPKTAAAPVGRGEVLSVNREFNFVIVNLGSNNGIREGAPLVLYRNGEATGELRVDMVDDTISAAAVLKAPAQEIQIGDEVRLPEGSGPA